MEKEKEEKEGWRLRAIGRKGRSQLNKQRLLFVHPAVPQTRTTTPTEQEHESPTGYEHLRS